MPQAVRRSEQDTDDILATLERQEQHISLAIPHSEAYRRAFGDINNADDDVSNGYHSQRDYLTPFLPANWDEDEPLTAAEAQQAYDQCMQVRMLIATTLCTRPTTLSTISLVSDTLKEAAS